MPQPLSGLRVVETGTSVSAPYRAKGFAGLSAGEVTFTATAAGGGE